MNDNTFTAGEIAADLQKLTPNAPVYTLGEVGEDGYQPMLRCNEVAQLCYNMELKEYGVSAVFDNPDDLYAEVKSLAKRRLKERYAKDWEDDPKKWSPEQHAIYSEIADKNQTVFVIGWNGAKEKE
ncbi:MAG: hypothetical protein IKU86_12325 [Thermoguttaceae bacterium]|nr:hypothetical protein [Thermoguttaceae bacterium]